MNPSAAAQAVIDKLNASDAALATASDKLPTVLGAPGDGAQAAFDLFAISAAADKVSAKAADVLAAIIKAAEVPALTISTTALPDAVVGQPYSAQLAVDGGVDPVTFTATGLPDGLSMDSAGAVTGTVNAPGVYAVVFSASDSSPTPETAAPVTLTLTAA